MLYSMLQNNQGPTRTSSTTLESSNAHTPSPSYFYFYVYYTVYEFPMPRKLRSHT